MREVPFPKWLLSEEILAIKESAAKWIDRELIEKRPSLRKELNIEKLLREFYDSLSFKEIILDSGTEEKDLTLLLASVIEELGRGNEELAFEVAVASSILTFLKEENLSSALKILQQENITPLFSNHGNVEEEDSKILPFNSSCTSKYLVSVTPKIFSLYELIEKSRILPAVKTTGLNGIRNCYINLTNARKIEEINLTETAYSKISSLLYLTTSAIISGAVIDSLRILDDWVNTRIIKGGESLRDNSLISQISGEVAEAATTIRILLYNMAVLISSPERYGISSDETSVVAGGIFNTISKNGVNILQRALEPMASAGYAKEWDIEKHWRDIRTIRSLMGIEIFRDEIIAGKFFKGE